MRFDSRDIYVPVTMETTSVADERSLARMAFMAKQYMEVATFKDEEVIDLATMILLRFPLSDAEIQDLSYDAENSECEAEECMAVEHQE